MDQARPAGPSPNIGCNTASPAGFRGADPPQRTRLVYVQNVHRDGNSAPGARDTLVIACVPRLRCDTMLCCWRRCSIPCFQDGPAGGPAAGRPPPPGCNAAVYQEKVSHQVCNAECLHVRSLGFAPPSLNCNPACATPQRTAAWRRTPLFKLCFVNKTPLASTQLHLIMIMIISMILIIIMIMFTGDGVPRQAAVRWGVAQAGLQLGCKAQRAHMQKFNIG